MCVFEQAISLLYIDNPVKLLLAMVVMVSHITGARLVSAREIKIGAGLSGGYEFYEHRSGAGPVDDQKTNCDASTGPCGRGGNDNYDRFRITPVVDILSASSRSELHCRYEPGLRYDFDESDHDIDHDLLATYRQSLSRIWRLELSDIFRLSDMAKDSATPANTDDGVADDGDEVSDGYGRRSFWTNNLHFGSEYDYRRDCSVSFGYNFHILKNRETTVFNGYEDYKKHEVTTDLNHRFTPFWRAGFSGSYSRGLFAAADDSQQSSDVVGGEDLSEYHFTAQVESELIDHNPLTLSYGYLGVDYDDENRDDSAIHNITLAWCWYINEFLLTGLGGGPSFLDVREKTGEWGYNGDLSVQYTMEKAVVLLTIHRGYSYHHFTGSDENGLQECWESKLEYSSRLYKELSYSIYFGYRDDDVEVYGPLRGRGDRVTDKGTADSSVAVITRKKFMAGASLKYLLGRDFSLTFSYSYLDQESKRDQYDYEEHRVNLVLSYYLDLFSW